MSDSDTNDRLQEIVRSYLRSRNEPPLRDHDAMHKEATKLFQQGKKLQDRAQLYLEMFSIFHNAHLNPSISPDAWDNLIRDRLEDDMQILLHIFPREEWPEGIAYPNLVAVAGHMDIRVAIDKANILIDKTSILAEKSDRITQVVELYVKAQADPDTSLLRWGEVTRCFDEEDFQFIKEIFPIASWPPERYGVPYPNLVALVKWNNEQQVMLEAWREVLQRRHDL